jgi:hypothetical protein
VRQSTKEASELRRTLLPRTRVNKEKEKGLSVVPRLSSLPSWPTVSFRGTHRFHATPQVAPTPASCAILRCEGLRTRRKDEQRATTTHASYGIR